MTIDLATWGLSRRNDALHWDDPSLGTLADTYGTPLHVVNRGRLVHAFDEFNGAFKAESVLPDVYFSVKTNPVPELLRVFLDAGCGLEVVSPHELRLAHDLAVSGSRIVVNGTYKSSEYIEKAVAGSVGLINVESLDELLRIDQISKRLKTRANIAIRVNPELRGRRFNPTVSTARASSPMGFIVGGDEWQRALELLTVSPDLLFRGIHLHLGSGIDSARPYREAMDRASVVWRDLKAAGFSPDTVDFGGGFSIQSCKTLSIPEAVKAIGWSASPKAPSRRSGYPLLTDIARSWREVFIEPLRAAGEPPPRLILEPGRALSASAQLLLIRVNRIVERKRRAATAICDAGAMSISPSLWSEYHSVVAVDSANSAEEIDYTVIGNMPSQLDVIAPRMTLPKLAPGDVLAVMDTGAYFTSFGNTFAGPRPPIVMIESSGDRLIRRRESYEELFSRDVEMKAPTDSGANRSGH